METVKPQGNLLLDERPLVVLPALAVRFGLNEAIALQQLHYWVSPTTGLSTNVIDGVKWAYNTYEEWQQQFPWWSVHTIQRIFTALERRGLVLARAMNVKDWDRRKWYTIDYAVYNALVSDVQCPVEDTGLSEDAKLAPSNKEHGIIDDARLAPSNPSKLAPSNPSKLAPSKLPKLAPSNSPYRNVLNGTKTTAKSTTETTTETTNDVVEALERAGLTREQARAAQRKHQLNCAEVERWMMWKRSVIGGRNPDALFAGLIKKQRLPPGTTGGPPHVPTETTPEVPATIPPVEIHRSDGVTTHLAVEQVWQMVLTALALHVPHDVYETWLKPTALLDVIDDVAIIGTPNIFVRQAVEERYLPLLAEGVRDVIRKEVNVRVVIGSARMA